MVSLLDSEKKSEDMITCFDTSHIHDRLRQQDRQTPHDSIGRAYG